MIIEEMKMWPEPTPPVVYNGSVFPKQSQLPVTVTPPFNKNKVTQFDINKEWTRGTKAGIKFGNLYGPKGSYMRIKIVGYNFDPATVEVQDGMPCVIKAERLSTVTQKPMIFDYTVDEILEMEQIYE